MIEQQSNVPGPKVTIFFSVPHSSEYSILGRAALKSFIHAAETRLEAMGTPEGSLQHIVDALKRLLHSDELWKHRSEGYAIFSSPSMLRWYALPLPVKEEVHVGNDFHITPLIQHLAVPEHYYLLEVSFGTPRMAKVHPQFTTPIQLDQVLAMQSSWDQENVVHDRAFHTSGSASNGHHGTIPDGGSKDGEFRRREHFLKFLAGVVNDTLKSSHSPLVITGSNELVAHFSKHLHYPNIILSPHRIPVPEGNTLALDTATWRLCSELYAQREGANAAIDAQLEFLRGEGRVTEDIESILAVSEAGGIMTLLLNDSAIGLNDPEVSETNFINAALIKTLRHHGNVLKFNGHQSLSGVMALLRPGVSIN